jgi:hypothetical protein
MCLQVMMPLVPFSRKSTKLYFIARLASQHLFFFSSIVGRPRHQGVMVGMGQKDSYVG